MTTPVNQPTAGEVSIPQPGPSPTDAQVNALASQLKSMVDAASAGSVQLSQATVAATALTATPPTVSVTMSGSTVQIDGVSFMEGYTPAVGDNVDLLKQGNAILVLGHVADVGTGTSTNGGWAASGITGISYRKVIDNGAFKVQFTGSGTATSASLFTLPVGFRPAVTRILPGAAFLANFGVCNVQITTGGVATLVSDQGGGHIHGVFVSLSGYNSQAGTDLGHSHIFGGGMGSGGQTGALAAGSLAFSNTVHLDAVEFFI